MIYVDFLQQQIALHIYKLISIWCYSTAGSVKRTFQGNNNGNVNSGCEYDRVNGQDHSTGKKKDNSNFQFIL